MSDEREERQASNPQQTHPQMPTALFLRRGYIKNGKQQEALSADVPGATVGFRRQIPLAAQPKRDEHGRKERLGPLPQNHPSQHRPNRPEQDSTGPVLFEIKNLGAQKNAGS